MGVSLVTGGEKKKIASIYDVQAQIQNNQTKSTTQAMYVGYS